MIDTRYFYLPTNFYKDSRFMKIKAAGGGNGAIVTYLQLVCQATKQNGGGKVTFLGKGDMTKEGLEYLHLSSDEFERFMHDVELLEKYGFVERGDGYLRLTEWDTFQPPEIVGDNSGV